MLGRRKRPRAAAKASGVVLEAVYHSASEIGLGGISDGSYEANAYRVRVRVTFDDGSTAEISAKLKRDQVGSLYEGDIVPVRYDPEDRSTLEIDVPALADRKHEWKAGIAELKTRMDRDGDVSDPKADIIRVSILAAKRKGDAAEVERLTALLADLEHGASGPTPQ